MAYEKDMIIVVAESFRIPFVVIIVANLFLTEQLLTLIWD